LNKREARKEKFRKIGAALTDYDRAWADRLQRHQFDIKPSVVQDKEVSSRLGGPQMMTSSGSVRPPSNTLNLGSLDQKNKSAIITPAGAVRQIDKHKTRNEFEGSVSYDLLAREDILGAKLDFSSVLVSRTSQKRPRNWKRCGQNWGAEWPISTAGRPSPKKESRNKIWSYFPDEGPLRRELYPKHVEFFRAGLVYRERLFCARIKLGKRSGAGPNVCITPRAAIRIGGRQSIHRADSLLDRQQVWQGLPRHQREITVGSAWQ